MLKINLVSEGKKPVVAQQKAVGVSLGGGGDIGQYLLLAAAVVGLVVAGVWWFLLNSTIKDNNEEIRLAEVRVAELEDIIRQVEEFEKKEADLQQKIQVITDLKNNQKGPVEIMNEISRALPDLLWVDRLQQAGDTLTLVGRAFNNNAVATFIENLDNVEAFDEPVLRDTSRQGATFTYTLTFRWVPPPPPQEEAAVSEEPAA